MKLSGADFYAITNKARQHALKRLIGIIETGESSQDGAAATKLDESGIVLVEADFAFTLVDLKPTLNEAAMQSYEKYFNSYSNKEQ
jgi:hypothetical protein